MSSRSIVFNFIKLLDSKENLLLRLCCFNAEIFLFSKAIQLFVKYSRFGVKSLVIPLNLEKGATAVARQQIHFKRLFWLIFAGGSLYEI